MLSQGLARRSTAVLAIAALRCTGGTTSRQHECTIWTTQRSNGTCIVQCPFIHHPLCQLSRYRVVLIFATFLVLSQSRFIALNAAALCSSLFGSQHLKLSTKQSSERNCLYFCDDDRTRRSCVVRCVFFTQLGLNVTMTVPAFSGYLLLSCGPPLAAGLPFFWHRSLLSLTVVSSMFAWLALLIFTSALFRAFVPLEDTVVGYLPLVLVPVIIEECARIGFWYMHKSAGTHLKQLADTASVRYSPLDELALSYSVGWGHAATHMLFQFGPFLPLTWNTATAYSTHCVNLSLFSVSVLTQLGIFGVLAGVTSLYLHHWCCGSQEQCVLEQNTVPSQERS